MIIIDSNVFVIDLRYGRDALFGTNRQFLEKARDEGNGATTLVNLLEVAGILSFNLNAVQLRSLVAHFPRRYGIAVLPAYSLDASLPEVEVSSLLSRMEKRIAFGDALVAEQIAKYAPQASAFVSWDATHFAGRVPLPVVTPEEYVGTGV